MSKTATQPKSDRIRVLNDNFRSTLVGGQVVMTAGVDALPLDTKARVNGLAIPLRRVVLRIRFRRPKDEFAVHGQRLTRRP